MDTENFALKGISEFRAFAEAKLAGITRRRKFVSQIEVKMSNFRAGKGMGIVLLHGLRGTGKTVGMLQMASSLKAGFFFTRADEMRAAGVDLPGLVDALDKINREKIGLKEKYFLFIDEITYIDDWGLKVKVLHDGRPNLMLVLTSSSALALAISPDLARRSSSVVATPLSFREYLLLKHGVEIPDTLSAKMMAGISRGRVPSAEFAQALSLMGGKNIFGIFDDYSRGDMPLALQVEGEEYTEGMKAVVKRVVYEDFSRYGRFDADVLPRAERMITFLSQVPADAVRIDKLSEHTGLSKETAAKLLEMFEKSLILRGLQAHGRRKSLRMPKKWMFNSASMRHSLAKGLGNEPDLVGNMREDIVCMHLSLVFPDIWYSHEADFVVPGKKLAFEVGGKRRERELEGFRTFTLTSKETIGERRMPTCFFALAF